jgi:excisionase family DNA binding protein
VKEKEDKLLNVKEASEKLGVSRWRVNQFINEGRIPAQKIGRSYVIRESDLELVRGRKIGRPLKANKT